MTRCPVVFKACTTAYRYYGCRCTVCKETKRKAEDRIGWNKSNRQWRNDHPEYVCLERMKYRCNNPNGDNYFRYGGRGIECRIRSWRELVACIGPKPGREFSVDRIDNNGHYEAGNIRWATRSEQARNRRPRCQIS